MSSDSVRKMPRGIDDPIEVLIWSLDEFIVMMTFFCIGLMLDSMLIGFAVGFVFSKILRKHRDSTPDGYLNHVTYWYGFRGDKGRSFINPFKRRWHE